MWLKLINSFTIFQVYSLIRPCFSSTSLGFAKTALGVTEDYIRQKNSSVHRGVFLSLSDLKIHEICQDFYSYNLHANPDENTSESGLNIPRYNLLVQEMSINGERTFHELSLVIMCITKEFINRRPPGKHHYLSTAFRSKWLYRSEIPNTDPTRNDQFLVNFEILSPDYVNLERAELEQWYLNTLRTISNFSVALSAESAKYIEQMENQDNLSKLTKKERLILCASILSSPVYHQDNLEPSLQWLGRAYRTPGATNFEEKFVHFETGEGTVIKMKTKCLMCKGFENGTDMNSKSTNLYITRTYNDGHSAMVLKERMDGTIHADKYFKNLAVLIATL